MGRRWGEDGEKMGRRWGEDGENIRRRWGEDEQKMRRGWGEDGENIRRRWGEDGEKMRGHVLFAPDVSWCIPVYPRASPCIRGVPGSSNYHNNYDSPQPIAHSP